MITELTPRHRLFCQGIVAGKPNHQAYTDAGYDSTGVTASAAATRLLKNVKIKDSISALHQKTESNLILTIKERKQMLTRIARNNVGDSPQVTIRAIAELNKMDGAYAAKQIEHKVDNFFENVPETNGLGGI